MNARFWFNLVRRPPLPRRERLPRVIIAAAFASLLIAQGIGAQELLHRSQAQYGPPPQVVDTAATSTTEPLAATERALERPAYNADGTVAVPIASEKAMRYYYSGWVIRLLNAIISPAFLLMLCFSGYSARMRTLSQRAGKNWFLTIAIYWLFFSGLMFVIQLPLAYYAGFVNEHDFGLSNQSISDWLLQQVKSLFVTAVVGALILWVPFMLLKKSPTRWWLYVGLVGVPFVLVSMLVQPILIEPIFNNFGQVKNRVLEQRIVKLAERAGIDHPRVFEVDKSRETKAINAYVSGIGNTSRIVFWDTLTAAMSEDQVMFVMGHEIGHYVLNHVWKSIAMELPLLLFMLYFVHRVAQVIIARFRRRLGFASIADIASLPLLLLLFAVAATARTPIVNAFNRHQEHQADVFALELTRNNRAAAEGFARYSDVGLDNPRPHVLDQLLFGTHATTAERIEFANTYKPWVTGQPLRFGELIRPED